MATTDAGATRIDRALPEYIEPAAEPANDAPLYPGVLDDEEPTPSPGPARPRERTRIGTDLGLLVLRWAVGALLVVRGTQELFGWFGGQGGANLGAQLQMLGYQHFAVAATAVSIAEVVIGALLIVGLFTEWACGGVLALSIVAVLAQHRLGTPVLARPGTGLGARMPGLEVLGGLGVLAVALALLGAGRLALDRNRFWSRAPLITALLALLIGVVVGVVLIQPPDVPSATPS